MTKSQPTLGSKDLVHGICDPVRQALLPLSVRWVITVRAALEAWVTNLRSSDALQSWQLPASVELGRSDHDRAQRALNIAHQRLADCNREDQRQARNGLAEVFLSCLDGIARERRKPGAAPAPGSPESNRELPQSKRSEEFPNISGSSPDAIEAARSQQAHWEFLQIRECLAAPARQSLDRTLSDFVAGADFPPSVARVHTPHARIANTPAHEGQECVSTDFLSSPRVSLWHANHVGPGYAKKLENQDSTYAISEPSRLFFALADGVSTSYGAGFAAREAVRSLCQLLRERLGDAHSPDLPSDSLCATLLEDAVRKVQQQLDRTLRELLAAPGAKAWQEVHGSSRLSPDVARRLCQNTLEPKNRAWGPVMATTLLGGIAVSSK